MHSQERILTVSSLVGGPYGIQNVCLDWPTVLNEKGILKTVNLKLSKIEEEQLCHSAQVLQEVFQQLSI